LRERDNLENLDLNARKYRNKSYRNMMGWLGYDRSGFRYGQLGGCCEIGNKLAGSIMCGNFIDYLRNS
jgi:hypothetical protein